MSVFSLSRTFLAALWLAQRRDEHEHQPVAHFRKLHERNIEAFQHRLSAIAEALKGKEIVDDTTHDVLHDLLHRYTEAIGDLESMNVRQAVSVRLGRTKVGDTEGKPTVPATKEPKSLHFELVNMLCPKAPKTFATRFRAESVGFTMSTLFQIVVATTVGAALIAPMLIMVLHPSRNTSLITTCVFVFAFASGLVIFNSFAYLAGRFLEPFGINSDMLVGSILQLKDIVGATAAYAAVLVVFVGVSTNKPT